MIPTYARAFGAAMAASLSMFAPQIALAAADVAVAEERDGKFFTAEDTPTFNVTEEGAVDWYTFSGFRRYHSECHVCHGPDGEGSSYAPALKDSALNLGYWDFVAVVASGRQVIDSADNQVMPAFGANNNVMCYVDDIYTYLLARGTESIPRGRPAKRADKPAAFTEAENACMQ